MNTHKGDVSVGKEHRMDKLDKVSSYIFMFFTYFGIIATVVIAVITTLNIITRCGFSRNISGIMEVSSLAMGFISFGALPIVTIYDRHIKVDLIVSRFGDKGKTIMNIINLVLCTVIIFILSHFTFKRTWVIMRQGLRATHTLIPYWPVYLFLAIMMAFTGICMIYNIVHIIVTGKPVDENTFGRIKGKKAKDVEQKGGQAQ